MQSADYIARLMLSERAMVGMRNHHPLPPAAIREPCWEAAIRTLETAARLSGEGTVMGLPPSVPEMTWSRRGMSETAVGLWLLPSQQKETPRLRLLAVEAGVNIDHAIAM